MSSRPAAAASLPSGNAAPAAHQPDPAATAQQAQIHFLQQLAEKQQIALQRAAQREAESKNDQRVKVTAELETINNDIAVARKHLQELQSQQQNEDYDMQQQEWYREGPVGGGGSTYKDQQQHDQHSAIATFAAPVPTISQARGLRHLSVIASAHWDVEPRFARFMQGGAL